MRKPLSLKPLPSVTSDEASAAVTMLGSVFYQLLIHHASHGRHEDRPAIAAQALDVARSAVDLVPFKGGTPEQRANTKALVMAVLENIGTLADRELGDKAHRNPDSLN